MTLPFLPRSREALDRDTKQSAIKDLLGSAAHSGDFYVLLIGATFLAIGAIFTDSVPLLIASMIVAPLGYPILALGLGITSGSTKLTLRAGTVLAVAFVLVLLLAMLAAVLIPEHSPGKYITFTSEHRITATVVAIVSGAIASYGLVRPKIASAITGVAIAVSLLPPLVATGIHLAEGDMATAANALVLFLLNVVGILLASVVVFTLFGMGREYKQLKD